MQTGFFIPQDLNDSFQINCRDCKASNGYDSGSLKGSNTSNREETGFLSTLIGIADDQLFTQQMGLVSQNSIIDNSITEISQLVDFEKLFEGETQESVSGTGLYNEGMGSDVRYNSGSNIGQTESDQAQNTIDNSDTNLSKSIRVSSFFGQAEENCQNMKSVFQSANNTMQKPGGDEGMSEEDGLKLKNTAQSSVNTTWKTGGDKVISEEHGHILKSTALSSDNATNKSGGVLWTENNGHNVKPDLLRSSIGQIEPEQTGNEVERGHTTSNDGSKTASPFDMQQENGQKLKIGKAPIHTDMVGSDKTLLLKSQMNFQKATVTAGKETINPVENLTSGDINHGEKTDNNKPSSQLDDKYTGSPFKDISFEGGLSKLKPCLQDTDTMARRMGIFHKGFSSNAVTGIDTESRDNFLSFSDSQAQDRIPETVSQSKDTEFLQKPIQTGILKQLVDKAAMNLNNGKTSIKINLEPEYLGRLRMEISTKNHHVTLKIMTEIPIVKEIIENNINHLRSALQVHGLQISDFDVFVAHDSDQHSDTYENANFSNMGKDSRQENTEDVLSDEENAGHLPEETSGENLIDYFA